MQVVNQLLLSHMRNNLLFTFNDSVRLFVVIGNLWEEHIALADFVPDKEKKAQQLELKVGEHVLVMRKDESGN